MAQCRCGVGRTELHFFVLNLMNKRDGSECGVAVITSEVVDGEVFCCLAVAATGDLLDEQPAATVDHVNGA